MKLSYIRRGDTTVAQNITDFTSIFLSVNFITNILANKNDFLSLGPSIVKGKPQKKFF